MLILKFYELCYVKNSSLKKKTRTTLIQVLLLFVSLINAFKLLQKLIVRFDCLLMVNMLWFNIF